MNRMVTATLSAILTLLAIAWALNAPRWFGVALYTEQFLSAMLALGMPIALLAIDARGRPRTGNAPWYDWTAAVAAMVTCGYMAVEYERIMLAVFDRPLDAVVVAVVCIVLLLESVRRVAGDILAALVTAFLLLGAFSYLIPGALQGREVPLGELFLYLATDTNAVLGTPLLVSSTIVVAFLLVGELLFRSGGANFFTDIAMSLMGRFRGGPSKIAIIASGLFGSISGSAVSNVASTGVVTIRLMRQTGYPSKDAGAIEAVASTGGQLMPPIMGAVAFLMAEFLQIPYRDVVVAALVPAILYYVSLFILVDQYAARRNLASLPPDMIPDKWVVLRKGGAYILPFAVLITALFVFAMQAFNAALLGAVTVAVIGAVIGYGRDRLTWRSCIGALAGTGRTVVTVLVVAAGAGIVIGALNVTGVGYSVTDTLARLGENNLALLLVLVAGSAVILGMGMPTVGVYVLLATLLAPSLVSVGVEPMAAHLFILYYGMLSMITPPIALAAFTAASIAETRPMETAVRSAVFGWVAYLIPFLFVLSPSLLLNGALLDNLVTPLTAVAGIWLTCGAISGYLIGRVGWMARLSIGGAGVLLMIPHDATMLGWTPNGIGAVVALAVVVAMVARGQKTRAGSGQHGNEVA